MQTSENLKRVEAMNLQRHKEMTSETARLLALARELEVKADKGDVDSMSAVDLHKAEQIEKLAKSVREKMKASISAD